METSVDTMCVLLRAKLEDLDKAVKNIEDIFTLIHDLLNYKPELVVIGQRIETFITEAETTQTAIFNLASALQDYMVEVSTNPDVVR